MSYKIKKLEKEDWSPLFKEVNDPPKQLYIAGKIPDYDRKFLCVVGSRKYSNYGKEVCEYLIQGLAGYPVSIVSGLALGIDSIAHRAAIKNKLPTVAIPGSGLNQKDLHPQSNVQLAEEIVNSGGTLVSEFESDFKATQWSFPQRNRIMATMSHAILVIEAEIKSGTLITAKYASGYNKELLAVPGSILSPQSEGPNMLLRIGATPVRTPEDILEALGLSTTSSPTLPLANGKGENTSSGLSSRLPLQQGKQIRDYSDCSSQEIKIIEILEQNSLPKDELLRATELKTSDFQTAITILEIKGLVEEKLGEMKLV